MIRAWIREQLVGKMGKDYSFDVRPLIPVPYLLPRLTPRVYRNFRSNTIPGFSFDRL